MITRNFPYGYKMEKGRIIVNEEEAAQIRKIFEMRLDGVGVYAIGKKLYEEKVPFFDESRDKSIKKVSAILYKPIYTGDKGFPAVIAKETFDKVQKVKATPFRQPRTIEVKNEETEEEYMMTHSEITERIREDITQMLKKKETDSDQVREMIVRFAQEKYKNIVRKENTS